MHRRQASAGPARVQLFPMHALHHRLALGDALVPHAHKRLSKHHLDGQMRERVVELVQQLLGLPTTWPSPSLSPRLPSVHRPQLDGIGLADARFCGMSGIAPIDAPNPREPLHDARHRKASLEQDDLTALLAKLDAVESGEAALEEGATTCNQFYCTRRILSPGLHPR